MVLKNTWIHQFYLLVKLSTETPVAPTVNSCELWFCEHRCAKTSSTLLSSFGCNCVTVWQLARLALLSWGGEVLFPVEVLRSCLLTDKACWSIALHLHPYLPLFTLLVAKMIPCWNWRNSYLHSEHPCVIPALAIGPQLEPLLPTEQGAL